MRIDPCLQRSHLRILQMHFHQQFFFLQTAFCLHLLPKQLNIFLQALHHAIECVTHNAYLIMALHFQGLQSKVTFTYLFCITCQQRKRLCEMIQKIQQHHQIKHQYQQDFTDTQNQYTLPYQCQSMVLFGTSGKQFSTQAFQLNLQILIDFFRLLIGLSISCNIPSPLGKNRLFGKSDPCFPQRTNIFFL